MGLAVGAPVARAAGSGAGGVGRFVLVFFGAAFAGAAAYFVLSPAQGPAAIGASGGVSGLLARAFTHLASQRRKDIFTAVPDGVIGVWSGQPVAGICWAVCIWFRYCLASASRWLCRRRAFVSIAEARSLHKLKWLAELSDCESRGLLLHDGAGDGIVPSKPHFGGCHGNCSDTQ